MTTITPKKVTAKGIAPVRDGIYKGLWNFNIITFGPSSVINPIIVDKDIFQHGGVQNVKCRVVVKNCTAIATSLSVGIN